MPTWPGWLQGEGKLDEAEVAARKAVDLAPEDAHYHDTLARLLGQAGRLEEAEAAVELAPDNASYHDTLARVLRRTGGLDEAEAAARRAVRLAPNNAISKARWPALSRMRASCPRAS